MLVKISLNSLGKGLTGYVIVAISLDLYKLHINMLPA
jgi:hypothetical protein